MKCQHIDNTYRVPSGFLPPEPAAPLATRAAGLRRARRRQSQRRSDHRGGRPRRRGMRVRRSKRYRDAGQPRGDGGGRWRGAQAGGQVFSDICYAALEGNLALRGVAGDDVCFRADDVEHDIRRQVSAQLGQPYTHLGEGVRVCDAVAENAGIGAAVVKSRDGAESFLTS